MSTRTDAHTPLAFLNRSGVGIRTYVGCSCGWKPKAMPTSSRAHCNAYLTHLRSLGLPRPPFVDARYGEGPAQGLTHSEWYEIGNGCDPFGSPCDVFCRHNSEVTA